MNVYLIGFMAAGKSTVGPLLARRLGWPFVDSDRVVERLSGKSVDALFAHEGEGVFRHYESRALALLDEGNHQVVAVGGGAPTIERNWRWLDRGLSVYLEVPAEALIARLARAPRPLLAGLSARERAAAVRRLLRARRPWYERAQLTLSAQGPPPEVAEAIARQVIPQCRS